MTNDYDVIIIGTRRGRRHARLPARADRPAHPAARARRLPAARARELGQPRGLHEGPLQDPREVDRQGRRSSSSPHQHYYVGGKTKFYGAILFRLRETRLRRGPPLRRHLARVADLLRRPRALLRGGRGAATSCTAQAGEDRTEPRRSRAVPVPGRHPRAAHPAAARRLRARPGTTRSTCPSASISTSPTPRAGPRASAATASTASPAWSRARPTRTSALRAAGARSTRT